VTVDSTLQPCGICRMCVPSLSLEYVGMVCERCRLLPTLHTSLPCKICSKETPTVHMVHGMCASCMEKRLDNIDRKLSGFSEDDKLSVDLIRGMLG